MNNSKAFGTALSKVRKDKGFTSAHQFFKGVGGSKSLGLSFMSYWDMERGKKLPKSWRLRAIIDALGIGQHSSEAQELVRAYFKALSGSDELLDVLSAPKSAGADLPSSELAEAAAHRAITQLSVNLTMDQWKLRCRDMVTHICQAFLSETAGWVTVKELSEATKFKPEEIKKALKALASGGLIELSKDKARGKFTGKIIQLLPMTPATAGIRAALYKNWNTWIEDCKRVAQRRVTVRMSKASLDQYRQHLAKAVNLANIYGNAEENRKDSAIYFVDATIFQILPKD
ncbi:MAG: hypothetical protein PHV36_13980 [Elusimicrobiales bacterium]|nr:hypothetical protein [Elusimicrobiales bacterium]